MRLHFVVNPKAGRIRCGDLVAAIREEFVGHDIRISSTPPIIPEKKLFRIEDLLWPSVQEDVEEMVVAVGGDGTVNSVINAVGVKNVPVGILPCGSSNDLAGALGIPTDFHKACQVIKAARLMDIDLISVNGRYFVTCGGLGLASQVADRANRWRTGQNRLSRLARFLGRRIYSLAVLRELFGKQHPLQARIITGDSDEEKLWLSLLVSNQPRFGGFSASPAACNRDGLADICEMKFPSRRGRLFKIAVLAYVNNADTCQEVSQHKAREFTMVTKEPVPFFGDGEILARGRFFRIQVRPRSLWVVVPNGARIWEWWRRTRDQTKNMVKCYLRRERCQPMNMSA